MASIQKICALELQVLDKSIAAGRLFQTKLLIKNGEVDFKDEASHSLLRTACCIKDEMKRTRWNMVALLIDKGCDVNTEVEAGMHVFSWFCSKNDVKQIEHLMRVKPMDIDYKQEDENGDTALHHAVRTGNKELVNIVLDKFVQFGIPIDEQNNNELTAYACAMQANDVEIAQLLVEKGKASTSIRVSPFHDKQQNHLAKKEEKNLQDRRRALMPSSTKKNKSAKIHNSFVEYNLYEKPASQQKQMDALDTVHIQQDSIDFDRLNELTAKIKEKEEKRQEDARSATPIATHEIKIINEVVKQGSARSNRSQKSVNFDEDTKKPAMKKKKTTIPGTEMMESNIDNVSTAKNGAAPKKGRKMSMAKNPSIVPPGLSVEDKTALLKEREKEREREKEKDKLTQDLDRLRIYKSKPPLDYRLKLGEALPDILKDLLPFTKTDKRTVRTMSEEQLQLMMAVKSHQLSAPLLKSNIAPEPSIFSWTGSVNRPISPDRRTSSPLPSSRSGSAMSRNDSNLSVESISEAKKVGTKLKQNVKRRSTTHT